MTEQNGKGYQGIGSIEACAFDWSSIRKYKKWLQILQLMRKMTKNRSDYS